MPRAFGETTWQQGSKPMDGFLEIVLCKSKCTYPHCLVVGVHILAQAHCEREGGGSDHVTPPTSGRQQLGGVCRLPQTKVAANNCA